MILKIKLCYESIRSDILDSYGIDFQVPFKEHPERGESRFDIRPVGMEVQEGFIIRTRIFENFMILEFIVEDFGASIFETINNHMDTNTKEQFVIYCKSISETTYETSSKVVLKINGMEYLPKDTLPENWAKLGVYQKIYNLAWSDSDVNNTSTYIPWLRSFVGIVLTLLPVKSKTETIYPSDLYKSQTEGLIIRTEATRYERSALNRSICLSHKGYKCEVCGFSFEEFYGEIGTDFAHVHHIEPVSTMGGEQIVNPLLDLAVVCANCHAMIHRKEPPFKPDELKKLIKRYEA